MTSIRLNNWIVALWALSAVLSVSDLYLGLEAAHGDFTPPSAEIRAASTHLLLAFALVILYSPQRRRVPIIAAAAVTTVAILIAAAYLR
jgi:hypothetical protein